MKLKPPQVENLPRGEHVFPQDDLLVNRLRLEGADWSYQSAAGMSLDQVVLVKAVLDGCILERARILDLEVLESAAAGVQLLESSVVRSAFTGCRMFGVQFGGAELKHVSFKDSKLAQASFRCAKMEGVLFRECDLTDADFYGAEMKSVTFERCTLARAGFAEAEMEDVDLRSSAVAEIAAGTLAGATVDPTQLIELAGHLARTLGIRVKL